MTNQPTLAVHLHLYYTDMWEQIRQYLANIGNYPYDLFVTMTAKNPALAKEIIAFHPRTKIWVVENRGYDVGPFIDFLHHIDLNHYDLVMKIHSKGTQGKGCAFYINGLHLSKSLWANFLFAGILGSQKLFNKIITQFEQDPALGMVGAKKLITDKEEASQSSHSKIASAMSDMGFDMPQKIKFIAGTMFICRAKILQPIKEHYQLKDFEPTDSTVKDGTLAHTMERIFGTLTTVHGYKIKGYDWNWVLYLKAKIKNILRFIYQSKITNKNNLVIKIFKLQIYSKKMN